MRLIDADALNKELQKRVGSPTDDKLYEVNLCIIDAPTIPAIQVEWMQQRRDTYMNTITAGNLRVVAVIDQLMREWQKEREATKG